MNLYEAQSAQRGYEQRHPYDKAGVLHSGVVDKQSTQ